MSPKDRLTVEKVSLAMLAVLGVVGLAFFMRPPLRSCQSSARPDPKVRQTLLKVVALTVAALAAVSSAAETGQPKPCRVSTAEHRGEFAPQRPAG